MSEWDVRNGLFLKMELDAKSPIIDCENPAPVITMSKEPNSDRRRMPREVRFFASICPCCAPASRHQYDSDLQCQNDGCGESWFEVRDRDTLRRDAALADPAPPVPRADPPISFGARDQNIETKVTS